jgi:hypothetical protein
MRLAEAVSIEPYKVRRFLDRVRNGSMRGVQTRSAAPLAPERLDDH